MEAKGQVYKVGLNFYFRIHLDFDLASKRYGFPHYDNLWPFILQSTTYETTLIHLDYRSHRLFIVLVNISH